jgi:hypothetical protein
MTQGPSQAVPEHQGPLRSPYAPSRFSAQTPEVGFTRVFIGFQEIVRLGFEPRQGESESPYLGLRPLYAFYLEQGGENRRTDCLGLSLCQSYA